MHFISGKERLSEKSECFVITLTLFLVEILISVVWNRKYQAVWLLLLESKL